MQSFNFLVTCCQYGNLFYFILRRLSRCHCHCCLLPPTRLWWTVLPSLYYLRQSVSQMAVGGLLAAARLPPQGRRII
jgi:hypothetical protein